MRSVVLALLAELAACVRVDFDPNGRDAGGDAPLALRARGVWSSAGNALSHTPAASGAQTFTFATWYQSSAGAAMPLCAGVDASNLT